MQSHCSQEKSGQLATRRCTFLSIKLSKPLSRPCPFSQKFIANILETYFGSQFRSRCDHLQIIFDALVYSCFIPFDLRSACLHFWLSRNKSDIWMVDLISTLTGEMGGGGGGGGGSPTPAVEDIFIPINTAATMMAAPPNMAKHSTQAALFPLHNQVTPSLRCFLSCSQYACTHFSVGS